MMSTDQHTMPRGPIAATTRLGADRHEPERRARLPHYEHNVERHEPIDYIPACRRMVRR